MKPYESTAPLHTERLVLRRLTLSEHDIDDLHTQQSDPELTTYMLYEPRDRATIIEKITEWTASEVLAETDDYVQLAIELPDAVPPVAAGAVRSAHHRERRPVIIGTLYFKIESAEDSNAEIGWALHPDFQGKGYAREAASALLDLAFDTLKLHRVFANLDPRNDDSVRLCLALGMRHEAHHVEDMWFKGAWADTGIYAILDREWAAHPHG
ncbi:GNAT family N-acetyltransferase [Salinibacterium sp. NG22]|uniref:GNAT family N-acetyltransferase n=1 Tax=Salinibacterium sp. NG22 TaxID=2792040 RepID=UPI0018CE9B13|nr:GNAT family protein [Salinibacterium sp. NG22]MBH0110263.1 GNAT family N-acetyltransferase [Salinibacterium sp. NG22]